MSYVVKIVLFMALFVSSTFLSKILVFKYSRLNMKFDVTSTINREYYLFFSKNTIFLGGEAEGGFFWIPVLFVSDLRTMVLISNFLHYYHRENFFSFHVRYVFSNNSGSLCFHLCAILVRKKHLF